MPSFFLIIFGIQFRVSRRGLNIPGWFSLAYAIFSFLTFLTLTGLAMMDFVVLIGMFAFNTMNQVTGKGSTAMIILITAEVLTVLQALFAITCAALAMVASYILSTQIVEKNRRTRLNRTDSQEPPTQEENSPDNVDEGVE
jgi:hypothetical protein